MPCQKNDRLIHIKPYIIYIVQGLSVQGIKKIDFKTFHKTISLMFENADAYWSCYKAVASLKLTGRSYSA